MPRGPRIHTCVEPWNTRAFFFCNAIRLWQNGWISPLAQKTILQNLLGQRAWAFNFIHWYHFLLQIRPNRPLKKREDIFLEDTQVGYVILWWPWNGASLFHLIMGIKFHEEWTKKKWPGNKIYYEDDYPQLVKEAGSGFERYIHVLRF